MKALFTGGGTGGHIYPSLSLAEKLKDEYEFEIVYVGSPDSMEERIMKEKALTFKAIESDGFRSKNPFKNLAVLLKLYKARKKAIKLLKEENPAFVFASGGYVSAPLALAAKNLKIPLFLHEQNSIPGLTNRLTSRYASLVFTTFSSSNKHFPSGVRTINSGLPVRKEFKNIDLEKARVQYKTADFSKTILITGGSGGALYLNKAVLSLYPWASEKNLQLIHVTGQRDFSLINEKYKQMDIKSNNIRIVPYLEDMHLALAASDIIISRAGASFLSEMTFLGKSGIIIPYPWATNNHQFENAKALSQEGAFIMLEEKELEKTPDLLREELLRLLSDNSKLKDMEAKSAKEGNHRTLEIIIENIFKETGVKS